MDEKYAHIEVDLTMSEVLALGVAMGKLLSGDEYVKQEVAESLASKFHAATYKAAQDHPGVYGTGVNPPWAE